MAPVSTDSTLAYIDQASFLALRALGRGPVIQYIWIYDTGVDLDGLRRFHANLQHSLLGRLIQRSSVPFGRHRWVTDPGSTDLQVAVGERDRIQVWDWVDEQSFLPIDPEVGPSWRLAVQPFIGGGAAVSLAVSHTTADAVAGIAAIADAVAGVRREWGFPDPRARTIRADLALTARSMCDIPFALGAASRAAREQKDDLSASSAVGRARHLNTDERPVVVPRIYGSIDLAQWDERAKALGATSNVLFAGFAARLGYRLGRTGTDGRCMLSVPVSERTEGDTRANPLASITVHADPGQVCVDLTELRASTKQALVELGQTREDLLAPLALVPYSPRALVRRLENLVLKVGKPIGCSNLGDIPAAVNRPDGTDADFFTLRGGEAGITAGALQRLGGHLLVSAAAMRGRMWFSVASWETQLSNTPAEVAEITLAAANDLGLTAELA